MPNNLIFALGAFFGTFVATLVCLTYSALVSVPAARDEGRALAEADARAAVISQFQERSETDANVARLPAADLCAAIGGVYENDRCQ